MRGIHTITIASEIYESRKRPGESRLYCGPTVISNATQQNTSWHDYLICHFSRKCAHCFSGISGDLADELKIGSRSPGFDLDEGISYREIERESLLNLRTLFPRSRSEISPLPEKKEEEEEE